MTIKFPEDSYHEWGVALGFITIGDGEEEPSFMVTTEYATEPAFHHLCSTTQEAKLCAEWFNWAKLTENEYLAHGSRLISMIEDRDATGFEKYIKKMRKPSLVQRLQKLIGD